MSDGYARTMSSLLNDLGRLVREHDLRLRANVELLLQVAKAEQERDEARRIIERLIAFLPEEDREHGRWIARTVLPATPKGRRDA